VSKFGTYRVSATRNYSAAIVSEHPANIRNISMSRASAQSEAIDHFLQADFWGLTSGLPTIH
jgi:hypothetical protein